VQRNTGLQYLEESNSTINFVAFLDDDVRPLPSYLKNLCQNLVDNPRAVGISGLAIAVGEKRKKPSTLLRNLKLIGGEGSLSRAAINTPVRCTEGIIEVEWLIGCSVWRFSQINDLRFEMDFSGQSVFEDVIFSIRAAKKGILLVNTHVKFDHLLAVESRPNSLEHYRSWVVNRYRLKTISPESIDTWRFTLVNFLMLLSLAMRAHFLGVLGIVLGSLELLRKK
jgi:GT2 family glycosyltransferase